MKKLPEASHKEIHEASDILARSAYGGITPLSDKFKQACAWGAEVLASLVDTEESINDAAYAIRQTVMNLGDRG